MCLMPALAQAVTADFYRFVASELLETLRNDREAIATCALVFAELTIHFSVSSMYNSTYHY